MKYQPFSRTLIATALVLTVSGVQAASQAPVAGENGMVVTAQHLATHVGVDVLKAGGNAVDAAVAVGYALAVVYPAAGNLGGGGFMTVQLADGRKTSSTPRKSPVGGHRRYVPGQGRQCGRRLECQGAPGGRRARHPCPAWSWP